MIICISHKSSVPAANTRNSSQRLIDTFSTKIHFPLLILKVCVGTHVNVGLRFIAGNV